MTYDNESEKKKFNIEIEKCNFQLWRSDTYVSTRYLLTLWHLPISTVDFIRKFVTIRYLLIWRVPHVPSPSPESKNTRSYTLKRYMPKIENTVEIKPNLYLPTSETFHSKEKKNNKKHKYNEKKRKRICDFKK